VDANGDRVIDYRSIQIDGTGSLQSIPRSIDPLTGVLDSSSSGSPGVQINSLRYRVRLFDYDITAPEPLSGVYTGGVESSNQGGVAGANIDVADFVVYQPGTASATLFTTNGFDPIKSLSTSPLSSISLQSVYQPNVWI
jgi:hypothetical protein